MTPVEEALLRLGCTHAQTAQLPDGRGMAAGYGPGVIAFTCDIAPDFRGHRRIVSVSEEFTNTLAWWLVRFNGVKEAAQKRNDGWSVELAELCTELLTWAFVGFEGGHDPSEDLIEP